MKFSCEKAILQSAVTTVSKAVSVKSAIPALEGILIDAGLHLYFSGYNLETGIKALISASIQEKGKIVVNARIFGEIVRKLPDEMVTVSSDEKMMIVIKSGMSEFNILGTAADDFPELPSVETKRTFTLQQKVLKSMIYETLFAVSDNDSKPIHTGSLFEINEDELTVVSVDGYRLALRREKIDGCEGSSFSFVVPGNALSEVEKISSDLENNAVVTQGDRHVMFTMDDTVLISRRLEGEFLAYKQAIPSNNGISVKAEKKSLIESVERVSLIINDKLKSPVRCVFKNGLLSVLTNTAIGKAYDECRIDGDGKDLEIGFNNRYLLDALKYAPAETVKIELNTGISPCIILPIDSENKFLYMVLPVRLKANE